jgi:NADH-quinone oxidoreductase subunit J
METYVFWPVAVLALLSGLGMVMARNPVHSALMLVLNFFAIAVFYVLLDAHFLAAAQVIVYAGAIMVLFLFVIMLTGVQREEDQDEPIKMQRPLALLCVVALAGILVLVMRTTFGTVRFGDLTEANRSGNTQGLGRTLFSNYLLPFEITSILLLVAAIGVIVLARRRAPSEDDREDAGGDDSP